MFYTRKRKYTFGIAVLLCTALVFFGCEEAGSSSSSVVLPAAPTVTATPADGQVTLSWQAVAGATSYKVYQGTSDNEVQNITEGNSAVITGLANGQAYSFWVAAVNSGGSTLSAEVTATPQAAGSVPAVPAVPAGLTAAAGNTQVVLSWTASSNTLVTGYKIRQTVSSTTTEIDVSGRETASHTVTGLINGTAYSFTIAAVTASTESAQSTAVTATPLTAPSVTATPADGQVTLIWQAVPGAGSYKVYQGSSTNEILTDSTITGTSAVVTGLTNGTAYSFWVSAVYTSGSSQSSAVMATPAAPTAAPSAPTLTATAGDNQVTLRWNAVPGATSYKVYQDSSEIAGSVSGITYTVTGLTAGTSYSFMVAAVNSVGSTQSTAATATPLLPAVTGLMATSSVEQVVLSWTASADTAVTGYKIRQTVSGTETEIDVTGMSTASHTVTGLTNGTAYSFTIAAVTAIAESAQSSAVTATPLAAPSVTATVADRQVTLSWAAVSGAASYKVYQDSNTNEILTGSTITGTSAVVTGLTNDQAYSFWVSAVNSNGSSQSSAVMATPAASDRTPLSGSTLTAAAGGNQVTLRWSAVPDATSYKVYQDSSEIAGSVSGLSHTVTGLTAGTSYSFTVRGANNRGIGPSSNVAMATPLPPAVTGLMATSGVEQVALVWTASADTAVTGYKIRQTVDDTETEIDIGGMTTARHTVSSLTAGKSYSFTIAAVAGSLESVQSDAVTVTPMQLAAPSVTAAVADSQVTLSWTAVTGASSYKVYQDTNTNEILTDSTITGTSAVVTGLTNNQEYSFWVTAVSMNGSSPQSAEIKAVPAEAQAVPPAAPVLSVSVGIEQVTLSWDAVAGAVSYKVYQDGSALSPNVNGLSHTVTGLTAGTQYSFTVSGVNSAGEGAQSAVSAVTPTPPATAGLTATVGVEQVALAWTASSTTGVTGYKVRQTVDDTTTEIDVTGMATATHTVTGLAAGKSYTFTIAAVAGSVESTQSDPTSAVIPTPMVPKGLNAAAGAEQAVLAWTASANAGVTGYTIEQTVDSTQTEIEISGRDTVTRALDLVVGKSYTFKIKAVAGSVDSEYSDATAAVVPTPAVPTGLDAAAGIGKVVLGWTASGNAGVTGYKIRTTGGSIADIDVSGRTTATAAVTGLAANTNYTFTIAAVAGSTESGQSAGVSSPSVSITHVTTLVDGDAPMGTNYALDGTGRMTHFVHNSTAYVAAASSTEHGISVFSFDGSSLTHAATVTDGDDGNSGSTYALQGANSITSFVHSGTAYVAATGWHDDGLSVFSFDGSSLTHAATVTDNSTYTLDSTSGIISFVSGSTRYIAATGRNDSGFSVFSFDGSSLTHAATVTDTSVYALSSPQALTHFVHSDTTYLVAASQGVDDYGFSVFSFTGGNTLTHIATVNDNANYALVAAGSPISFTRGSTRYIAVRGNGDYGFSVFSFDGSSLTHAATVTDTSAYALRIPNTIADFVHNSTTYVAAVSSSDHGISVFSFDGSTLDHAAVVVDADDGSSGSTYALRGGSGIVSIVQGSAVYLAVSGSTDDGITVFKIE